MDQQIVEKNLLLISERWPDILVMLEQCSPENVQVEPQQHTLIVNNIQLTANYQPEIEAELQASRIDPKASIAHVYGTGVGGLQQKLLDRECIIELNVCILNFTIFYYSLALFDHRDWLADPRTNLFSYQQSGEVYSPFVALPAELVLADDLAASLRDKLELELSHDYLSKRHSEENTDAKNAIAENFNLVGQTGDVKELFNLKCQRVVIAAAGPTLADHLPWLMQGLDKDSILIALDASVKVLLDKNIIPDVVISIDQYAKHLFDGVDLTRLNKTSLVYTPRVNHHFLDSWPGQRYATYSSAALYDDIAKTYPRAKLFSGGSVIHSAVDLAVKIGAREVLFLGADFAFTHNRSHAHDIEYAAVLNTQNTAHWVFNSRGEKVPTLANLKGYLRDLEHYIATQPQVTFYTGSELGAKIEGAKLWRNK